MESLPNYDSWKTGNWGEDNVAPEKPVLKCDACGKDIYEGDVFYVPDGYIWCEACIEKVKQFA